MIDIDVLTTHRLRMQELRLMAEQNRQERLARQGRRPREQSLRQRLGQFLIRTGQVVAGQPSYSAYDEALAVANRSWS